MGVFQTFSVLVLKHLVPSVGGAVAGTAGEKLGEEVGSFFYRRFTDHSHRLTEALQQSGERSWAVIEMVLRRETTWDRLRHLIAPADEKSLRELLESALDRVLQAKRIDPPSFRRLCLRELEAARGNGLISGGSIDLKHLADSLGRFAHPEKALEVSANATRELADELKRHKHTTLASLAAWKPTQEEPLVVFLGQYFFRQVIEGDSKLFQGLTFTQLKELKQATDQGFANMQGTLAQMKNELLGEIRGAGHLAPPNRVAGPGFLTARQKQTFHFSDSGLIDNPEPRLPCVLVVDVSKSMAGERIEVLNEGLRVYQTELRSDNLASQRVEVAIVSFGSKVQMACPFVTVEEFRPPILTASGKTALGEAVHQSLDMVECRKRQYRQHGISSFAPWIFLITDGEPTDEWQSAGQRIKEGEATNAFFFYAVGVDGAKFDMLRQLTTRPVYRLQGLRFRDLFRWLSQSQRAVSRSTPGRDIGLTFTNPAEPGGWAQMG